MGRRGGAQQPTSDHVQHIKGTTAREDSMWDARAHHLGRGYRRFLGPQQVCLTALALKISR